MSDQPTVASTLTPPQQLSGGEIASVINLLSANDFDTSVVLRVAVALQAGSEAQEAPAAADALAEAVDAHILEECAVEAGDPAIFECDVCYRCALPGELRTHESRCWVGSLDDALAAYHAAKAQGARV